MHLLHELVEAQRPVVQRRRQPEAEVDERLLARAVALVHPADLRDGLVRLVDEDEEVVAEVVEQRERMRSRRAALEDARVVLDPRAEAELLHHLDVVLGALAQPVRLEQLVLARQLLHALLELVPDLVDRALDRRLRRDVLRRRPDRDVVEPRVDLARQRIEVRDLLHLVAEEGDAVRGLLVRRLDLDDVALDAEAAAAEHGVVAHVLRVDQLAQDEIAVVLLADLEVDHPLAPLLRRAEPVDARDRSDDDHVLAREQRRGRGEPQARDVVVLRGVLLDVEIGLRDVRLGLVVVVVGDEVLDRVVGKNSRNSLQSCAASVLLCAMISVGFWISSMSQAIVAVLPVPVAPSSVWKRSPARIDSASFAIAAGWSPVGTYSEDVLNGGIREQVSPWRPSDNDLRTRPTQRSWARSWRGSAPPGRSRAR